MNKIIKGFMIAFLVSSSVLINGIKVQAQEERKETAVDLLVGVMPATDSAPIFWADEYGLFEEAGISVQVELFTNAMNQQSSAQTQQIDVYMASLVEFIIARENNTDAGAITTTTDGVFPIVVSPEYDGGEEVKIGLMEISVTNYIADLLIYTENVYGSAEGNQIVNDVFETMAVTAYETSIELAKEKGSFPFLVGATDEETQALRQRFVETGYMQKMPAHIREGVLEHGIRNSHLLTVAPTGSTGTMVGVATGLEPYFAFKYFRSGRLGKFIEVNADIVSEYLAAHPEADENNLPAYFVSAMELAPEAHVDTQTAIQYWVDSSISKTVNAPKGYTVSQVEKVYERLYKGGAKGGTVYVDGSRDSQVLTLAAEENEVNTIELFDMEEARIVDDKNELRQLVELAETEHYLTKGHTDDVVYGSDIGDTCPICRQGVVEDIGGCNTCVNCNAQLRCGL